MLGLLLMCGLPGSLGAQNNTSNANNNNKNDKNKTILLQISINEINNNNTNTNHYFKDNGKLSAQKTLWEALVSACGPRVK